MRIIIYYSDAADASLIFKSSVRPGEMPERQGGGLAVDAQKVGQRQSGKRVYDIMFARYAQSDRRATIFRGACR